MVYDGIWIWWYNPLSQTTSEKYDNNGKGGYFRFDDDDGEVANTNSIMKLTRWNEQMVDNKPEDTSVLASMGPSTATLQTQNVINT